MMSQLFSSFVTDTKNMRFQGEDGGEEILYVVRKHFVTNIGWIFLTFFFLLVPVLVNSVFLSNTLIQSSSESFRFLFIASLFWYLFVFGFVLERFLNWFFNINIVTNHRIVDMDFFNLLSRSISEAPLRNIEDVTYKISGLLGIIFNYGTVTVQTAAEKREFEFESLGNPSKIVDIISDLVKEIKHK